MGHIGNGVKVHELFPEADKCGKVQCFREHVGQVRACVHVHRLDNVRVTKNLYPLLPGIHVAEPTLA